MKSYQDNLFRELIVDNFAGGGGASTGIELATALVRANYNVIQVPKLQTMEELHSYMQRR